MIKTILSRLGILAFATCIILAAAQCSKDKGDGDGCYNTVAINIDSADIPDNVNLGDSVTVIAYATARNFCYSDFNVHISPGDRSVFCNADILFNNCQTCATSVKATTDTFKIKADKKGKWRFQFRNDYGDSFDSMQVN